MANKMIFGLVLVMLFAVPTFALSNAPKLEFSDFYGNVFFRWDDEWETQSDVPVPERAEFSSAEEYLKRLQYLNKYYNTILMRIVKYVDFYIRSEYYTDAGYDELIDIQKKWGNKAVLTNKLEVEAHREISGLDYDYSNPGMMRN